MNDENAPLSLDDAALDAVSGGGFSLPFADSPLECYYCGEEMTRKELRQENRCRRCHRSPFTALGSNGLPEPFSAEIPSPNQEEGQI